MNKRVTLKLRRRILAFAMAFVLIMISVVTIPELGMKAQAADGTMSYVVTISGGTGAVVSDEFTMPSNFEYKTSLTYKGNKLVRLKRDAITDDTLRFKQWNVLVEYKSVNTQSYATANIGSYETVLTDNFFRGDDPMKLKARERTVLANELENPVANWEVACIVTITAELENKYAAISFDGNGATSGSMEGTSIEKDTVYPLPDCGFTKDSHRFAGWKLDDSHVYQPGNEVTITDDTTFTAVWEKLCNITLSAIPSIYGTVTGKGSYVAGETVTVKATPYSAYLFINWTEDGEVVSTEPEYSFTVSEDRDLVANFGVKRSIRFSANGGSGSMETLYVATGSSYTLPECTFEAPNEEMFFDGWDKGNPGDVITITSDTYIGPVWHYKTYLLTVTVNSEEMGTASGGGYYEKNQYANIAAYANQGFAFDHWEVTGEEENITSAYYSYTMPGHAVELKAVFKRVAYPVHFASNGGTGYMDDVYVSIGGTYTLPHCDFVAASEYYEFDHWKCVIGTTTVDNLKPDDEITVTAETTLYAVWKPVVFIVNAMAAGGGSTAGSDTEGTYGCEVTVRATPAEHYHFVYWWDGGYNIVSTDPVYTFVLTENTYLTARFDLDTYPVSFDANGGSGAMLSASVVHAEPYSLPECAFTAPEGKTFGWWEKDEEKYYPEDSIRVYGPVTVKAVWINDVELEISEANFPDANFRGLLAHDEYDNDGDGFLSALEIANITDMRIWNSAIEDLTGIGYFTELKILHCEGNKLTSLDLSGLTKLESLCCASNPLTSLSLTGNPNLLVLRAGSCSSLASLNLTANTELKELWIQGDTALESIDLSHNMNLEIVDISSLELLASIDLSGHDKLENLDCSICTKVETLDLTGCTALKNLNVIAMHALTELNLNGLNALEELHAGSLSAMTSVTISNVSTLKKLNLAGSQTMESLTLSDLPNLEELTITETKLTSIDVSGFPNLQKLSVLSNDKLESITFGSVAASLKELDISYDKTLSVNLASFTNLEQLFCIDCGLTTLDARGLTKLCSLTCRSNKLTSLNIDGLTDLELVDCRFNQLTSLDISSSPKLVANPGLYVLRDSSVTLITDQPYDGDLVITGVNLTLQDNLSFNLYSSKSLYDKDGYGEPYIVFNVNGTERTVRPNPAKSTTTDYAFTCNNIAPHMIGDEIGFTIYVMKGDQKIKGMSSTYSVTTYCNKVLEAYTTKSKLTTLIVDLLNYGAAAQNYMDYKTDTLVNAGLTTTQQSWATEDRAFNDVSEKLYESEADLDDATFLGAALNLGETVSIRYVFTAESLSGLTLKVTDERGNCWMFTESDFVPATETSLPANSYSLYCKKLHAGRMSDKVYATLYRDGKKSMTVAYSIESYASKAGSGTSKLQLLLKAMMKYGDAARKCAE